jgi:DNA-binding helix-hairpin-helix protein with protein kinase domain
MLFAIFFGFSYLFFTMGRMERGKERQKMTEQPSPNASVAAEQSPLSANSSSQPQKRARKANAYETRTLGDDPWCFCNGAIITGEADIAIYLEWIAKNVFQVVVFLRVPAVVFAPRPKDQQFWEPFPADVASHFNIEIPPKVMTKISGPMLGVVARNRIPSRYNSERHMDAKGEASEYGTYKHFLPRQ